jgi:DNA-binding transcriptional ArsR family regulator
MRTYRSQADFLKTISHPTRLAVLEILRDGEQCVCHMEAMLGLRQASISQQLMILRETGLVEVRRDGLNVYYRVVKQHVFQVLDAIYSATGKPRRQVVHKHGKGHCPCPKCNAVNTVPVQEAHARGQRVKMKTIQLPSSGSSSRRTHRPEISGAEIPGDINV